jgi:type IV pilus assembly protein PilQ
MKIDKIVQRAGILALGYAAAVMLAGLNVATAADANQVPNRIEKIDVATLPGEKLNVKVILSRPLQNVPAGFTMSNPSRIALDFPDTASALQKNLMSVDQSMLRSMNIAQGKGRTRLVFNLNKPTAYTTSLNGSEVSIVLQASDTAGVGTATVTRFAEAAPSTGQRHSVSNVDFMRGKNGEGRIIVDLSDSATGIDIRQQGQKILVDFLDADLPENLQRRLNVTDFATPVLHVDTMRSGKNVRMIIEPKGLWEHSAYQADRKFIIDVRPLVEDPNKLTRSGKQGYTGEKLSLNFQDVEVRSVLQVIADFTGFNIITGDNVSGNLTLRLKDVPWDQALDIIMQTRGLGMRKNGNVIWIAPNEELAAKEKSRLEAEQEIADREPLVTQSFLVKYQKAADIRKLISDTKQPMLSKRGSAVIDPLSNTIFVQDTEKSLTKIEKIINQIDVPIRQVLIEGRIVLADDGFSKALGARFGVARNKFFGTGSVNEKHEYSVGSTLSSIYSTHNTGVTTTPNDLNVNLPVTNPTGSIGLSLFRLASGLLLNLELSAAEADNKTRTISSPKVITGNQQKAIIESGVDIPYQEASSAGNTSTSFKKATLGLEVTPQITPDNKINMDLLVKKDSVGEETNGVPSINTNRVETKVLVDNGETAVLGGIYEEISTKNSDKVPLFGDLPIVGRLFKRTSESIDKNELLIFITPRLIDDSLRAD